jgi:hypothetical protein
MAMFSRSYFSSKQTADRVFSSDALTVPLLFPVFHTGTIVNTHPVDANNLHREIDQQIRSNQNAPLLAVEVPLPQGREGEAS